MRNICKLVTGIYVMLCLGALAIIPLNAGGMLGEPDPMSGIFAVVLGMPWLHLLSNLVGEAGGTTMAGFIQIGVSMGINAAILWYGCQWLATGKITPD